jgi:hypothetical protein
MRLYVPACDVCIKHRHGILVKYQFLSAFLAGFP